MEFIKRFLKTPEDRALELTLQHAVLCEKAVITMTDVFYDSLKHVDEQTVLKKIEMVVKYEEEADSVRRKIVEELARGILPPLSREDFIRLVERMDMVADWAKDIARILRIIPREQLLGLCKECLLIFLKYIRVTSIVLRKAVESMNKDFEKTLRYLNLIEKLEERADDSYLNCLKELEKTVGEETANVLLLEKLIEDLENLEDACEDTSDVIKVIIIRSLR
ncbi:MAG: hypothetical protein DRJ34_00645 [Thermoprotei archaeon]|nr:MAG: hypothetical protein DRJ45_07905 [Thermoprotei archaeon]RLE69497.1 MAG: hypothetical protein DRJ34_00645 [Thermoprotei archaeon]